MSGNFSIPSSIHPLLSPDGRTMDRVWYNFLQGLSGTASAPQVSSISAEAREPIARHPPEATSTGYASEHDTEPPPGPGNLIAIVQQVLQNYNLIDPGGGGASVVISGDNVVPITKTSNYSATYADYGAQFDNDGATGSVTITLPPWVAGLRYSLVVIDAQPFAFATSGTDHIATQNAIYTSATSSTPYSTLTLVTSNEPGIWVVASQTGSWSYA